MGLMTYWEDTFRIGRIFILLVCFECIGLVVLQFFHLFDPNVIDDFAEIAVIVLFLLTTVFFLYYAIDGIIGKNLFEILCFLLCSLLLLVYAIVELLKSVNHPAQFQRNLILLIAHAVFAVIYIVFFVPIYREIGWSIFKHVGAQQALRTLYKNAQLFITFLRLDVQFTLMLLIAGGLFVFKTDDYELYVDIAATIVSLFWAWGVWKHGLKKEKEVVMYLFLAFAIMEPVYITYKLVQIFTNAAKYANVPTTLFTLLVSFGVFIRIILVSSGAFAWKNFGRGLKEEVFMKGKSASGTTAV